MLSVIVSQHVIEHLELIDELLPLFSELKRVLRLGGQIWLSCPDMEKICRLYVDGRTRELVEDRTSLMKRVFVAGCSFAACSQ